MAGELTMLAQGINDVFLQLDYSILGFYHDLAERAGWLYYLLYPITLTGWKGAALIALSLVMLLFRRTRKTGLCCILALTIGAVIVNGVVKNAVARPRPYNLEGAMGDDLRLWWAFVGSHPESDFCFPSGHMNAACAFASGVVFTRGKRWLLPMLLYVVLMGVSRNYLMVHYPSDVFFGFFFGVFAGLLAYLLVRWIYRRWGDAKLLRQ